MKKYLIALAFLMTTVVATNAQSNFWNFSYPMSFAVGETAEKYGDTSFRGFTIDGRGFIRDKISIGGMVSWEVFDQIDREYIPRPITDDDGNVIGARTGTPYYYLNTIPIMVNGHYYLGTYGKVRTFFGLGIGTVYAGERKDEGIWTTQTDKWRFGLQPEVGAYIPFGLSNSGATVSLKYRYATSAGNDTIEINFLSLAVGIGFMN